MFDCLLNSAMRGKGSFVSVSHSVLRLLGKLLNMMSVFHFSGVDTARVNRLSYLVITLGGYYVPKIFSYVLFTVVCVGNGKSKCCPE